MLTFEAEVDALVTAGLLTERQAEAFVYREIELTPRQAAADEMGVSKSALDNYRGDAIRKLGDARATVEALDAIRNQLPDDV